MEAAATTATRSAPKVWERLSKEDVALSFSLGVAYAWICSIIASVLSLSPLKSRSSKSTEDPIIINKESIKSITPTLKRKTLILDLDETLVHSTIKPVTHHHLTVDVMIDGLNCTFYVIKRPHVDLFLKKVSEWFDVVIFTASMQQYADPLINQLDPSNFVGGRLFRESCLAKEGNFIKDLSHIQQDLTSTIIIDNSPIAYSHNKENAIPIDNWMGDNPSDDALLNMLPFLNALRFTSDVRSILSLRGN